MPDELEWLPSSVAFFLEGRSWPFTSPLRPAALLAAVAALAHADGARGAAPAARRRRRRAVRADDRARVDRRGDGRARPTTKVWGPLLRGKFGDRADDISMAWLWGKLTMRRKLQGKESRQELLGYPRRSWEPLFAALRERDRGRRRARADRPARASGSRRPPRRGSRVRDRAARPARSAPATTRAPSRRAERRERYDAVVATVPNDVFRGVLDDLRARATATCGGSTAIEYHTALCLLLELDRSFTPFYWTNIADPELPFVGVIEHTNLVAPERYGGRRFLYVANYLAPGHELLGLDADALLARYEPGLRRINPGFDRAWVRERWLHREPAAQPIVTVGYGERIPPLQTGVPGLVLANTTQIYPEDRGTNYAVRLGTDAAAALLSAS